MSRVEWRRICRNPAIWVACLVCIPFFAFFTYTVNEGLLARQRIQMYPALLVLLATPILLRQRAGRGGRKSEGGGTEVGGRRSEGGGQRMKERLSPQITRMGVNEKNTKYAYLWHSA